MDKFCQPSTAHNYQDAFNFFITVDLGPNGTIQPYLNILFALIYPRFCSTEDFQAVNTFNCLAGIFWGRLIHLTPSLCLGINGNVGP